MKMIVPITVNDAVLTNSNIPETDYAAWSGATAYVIGDRVILVSTHSIYECIANNTNKNPSTNTDAATYWVRVGATNKWRAFDSVIQDQAVRPGGISYELDVNSSSDGIALFNLDAESVTVKVSDPLVIRRNLLLSTGNFTASEWLIFGDIAYNGLVTAPDGTNTAQVFTITGLATIYQDIPVTAEQKTYSVYVRSDNISFVIIQGSLRTVTSTWNRVSMTNPIGTFAIDVSIPGGGQLELWHPQAENGNTPTDYQEIDASGNVLSFAYERTQYLQDYSDVEDYWSYFFSPIQKITDIVFTEVPSFSGTTVYISIDAEGDAKVGEIALGKDLFLGDTHIGASVGIQDFSRKERDTFGNFIIIERAYADTMDVNFSFDASKVSFIRRALADRRSRPTVFHSGETNDQFGLLTYGFYKDINFPIVTRNLCVASIEIEGLT